MSMDSEMLATHAVGSVRVFQGCFIYRGGRTVFGYDYYYDVKEIKFHDRATSRDLLLEFGNKYQRCLKEDDIMCKVEKDGSYSLVIIKQNHPATWHYSKKLEIMRFTARYGHYNRLGVPQFTL